MVLVKKESRSIHKQKWRCERGRTFRNSAQPSSYHQQHSNTTTTMTDFLARESEILGGEFSSAIGSGTDGHLDFDRAASAFPDISLDGSTDIPTTAAATTRHHNLLNNNSSSGFSFDDFSSPPPSHPPTDVKVTGDDELEQFESQFPDIDVPVVSFRLGRE
jgi:hypothetical protein